MTSPASGHSGNSIGSGVSRHAKGSTIPDALSVEENGRLFNAYREGKYLLPNDGDEQNRLDLQHHVWLLLLKGRLHFAPVKQTANVLDIGTGTGIWAIQFAQQYPHSTVIGTDLSLIQPTENLPPNCTFEREDAEDEWIFDKPFDFIHWRLMCTCFSDFKAMISKVYSNLAPGGWAEFHEWGGECSGETDAAEEFYQASALARWHQYFIAGGATLGRDFRAAVKFKTYMTEAGFTDVVQEQVLAPINGWPLDPADQVLGRWNSLSSLCGLEAAAKLLLLGGLSSDAAPAFVDQVRADITNWKMRGYVRCYVVYGRKPEAPSQSKEDEATTDAL